LPPERLFSGVEILMQPKWGINSVPLHDLYGSYVRTTFEPLHETDFWIVQRRRAHQILTGTDTLREPAQLFRVGGGDRTPP
jgi:hypothetical protein